MNASANARVIGFDFGLKRIGVAAGNIRTGTSQGLSVLAAKDGAPDWRELARLLEQWLPSALVVGLPLHMDGSESEMATRARAFAADAGRRFSFDVVLIDERLTSVAADALLAQATAAGKSQRRKRARHRDSLAAELIVRAYLDQRRD
ncbi:MAG: Holliday junction resolvase RuvX [bacterium]